ncbi:MAG: hypothetical protein JO122_10170 [Acetobacteraceae bacterium]|nr:hypothetical protein [Acetobacteraceae bacterium]
MIEAFEDYVDLALQSADLLCERGSLSPDFVAGVTRHVLGSLNGALCRRVTLTRSRERILQAVDPRHDLRAHGGKVILSCHLVLDRHQRALDSLEWIVAHSCQYGLS